MADMRISRQPLLHRFVAFCRSIAENNVSEPSLNKKEIS